MKQDSQIIRIQYTIRKIVSNQIIWSQFWFLTVFSCWFYKHILVALRFAPVPPHMSLWSSSTWLFPVSSIPEHFILSVWSSPDFKDWGSSSTGSHTNTRTKHTQHTTTSDDPCSQTHKIIVLLIKQGVIIIIKHQHATGGSNNICGRHAEQKKHNRDVKAIMMLFAWR